MKRVVVGVNRDGRVLNPDRQLALFEGEGLADQYIDMLYREEWTYIAGHISEILVDPETLNKGFEAWKSSDAYGPDPLFYKTRHELWNQVPPNIELVPDNRSPDYLLQVDSGGAARVVQA